MRPAPATDVRPPIAKQAITPKPKAESKQLPKFAEDEEPIPVKQRREYSTETRFMVDAADSAFRALIRLPENTFENEFIRVPYRIATEAARKTSEVFLGRKIEGQSLSRDDLVDSLARGAENSAATALIEPSFFEGATRMGVGFLNMIGRIATRLGMFLVSQKKIPTSGELNLGLVPDELLSRSVPRIIPVLVKGAESAIGLDGGYITQFVGRATEQMTINSLMHHGTPIAKVVKAATGHDLNPKNAEREALVG